MSYQEQAREIIGRERPFQEIVNVPRNRPLIALNSDIVLQYIRDSNHSTDTLHVTGFVNDPLVREDYLRSLHTLNFAKPSDRRSVGTVFFRMGKLDTRKALLAGEGFKYRLRYLGIEDGAMKLDVTSTDQLTVTQVDSSEDARFILRKLRSDRPVTRENPLGLTMQELAVPIDFAHPIDAYIYRMRRGRFSLRDGSVRPVLPDNAELPNIIVQGVERGLVNANNLASALFNVDYRNWSGTIDNFHIDPIEPNFDGRLGHPLVVIDSDMANAFVAQADLVTLAGVRQAVLKRRYLLYVTKARSRQAVGEIPRFTRELARQLYPRAELHDIGILWMNSIRLDFDEAARAMHLDRIRVAESGQIARRVESAALFHPFQAGLMMPK